MYQRGVTMVELLMVIVLAAVIMTAGLRLFKSYQTRLQWQFIQRDITIIKEVLNTYYETLPCNRKGELQGPVNQDLIDQLPLDPPSLVARLPMVQHYRAYIRQTNERTQQDRPVYQLEVVAVLASAYHAQIPGLAKQFNATSHTAKQLIWVALPRQSQVSGAEGLWVMQGEQAQFQHRHMGSTAVAFTHAYCAR